MGLVVHMLKLEDKIKLSKDKALPPYNNVNIIPNFRYIAIESNYIKEVCLLTFCFLLMLKSTCGVVKLFLFQLLLNANIYLRGGKAWV